MLFTEGRFFLFFLGVFAVHWTLRPSPWRKNWLLCVSYVFYGCWDWRFLGLILFSTAVDYFCARRMSQHASRRARRPWLAVSLTANLGLLGFFKYFDFFAVSAGELAGWFGWRLQPFTLGWVLPVGISFFTFQTLSYTLDVYRGRLEARRSFSDVALFVAFFPQLVAGPIVRASAFLPQVESPRRFVEHVAVRRMLALFLVGFFKKSCLADGIGIVVDPVFADPGVYSALSSWLAVALYHVQIYCDFSGYSDMAIACAGLLGYQLQENFRFPYLARNIADFWRRWHISLASWLRDYLYLPLVGRNLSGKRRVMAVYVTVGLCGLWHGAGWNYVAFGLLHATYLVVHGVWLGSTAQRVSRSALRSAAACALLNLALLLTWPVFRCETWEQTQSLFRKLAGWSESGAATLPASCGLVLLGAASVHFVFGHFSVQERWSRLSPATFSALYGLLWSLVLPWVQTTTTPFIYFQF